MPKPRISRIRPVKPDPRFDFLEDVFHREQGQPPALLKVKHERMAGDPFRFFRGTAATFHLLWERTHKAARSPVVWASGDAHWENIGSYRGKNRVAYFDWTDFDHACLAPLDADLGRALTAYHVDHGAEFARFFLAGYRAALISGKPRHVEREVAKGLVRDLLEGVRRRKRKRFLSEWTEGGLIRRIDGETYRLATDEKRRALRIFRRWARQRKRREFFRVLDICGSLSGIGTLGLRRYLVLVKGGKRPHLIDMKQCAQAALAQSGSLRQPAWACEAERVATVQNYAQYEPISHLGWTKSANLSFILSDFQPMEDRIDTVRLASEDRASFSRKIGRLLGWEHLRTASWRGSAGLDALMAYGRALSLERQRELLWAASEVGRVYANAYDDFRRLVAAPSGGKR